MFIRLYTRFKYPSRRYCSLPVCPDSRIYITKQILGRQRGFEKKLKGEVFRGRAHIIDGDTIRIGFNRFRLAGVDAPELNQPWGKAAKWALVALCKGVNVVAVATGEISHGRLVATCYLSDGTDIGAEMVWRGLALDFTPFSNGKYRALEPFGARRQFAFLDRGQKRMLALYPEMSRPPEHPF